MSRRNAVFFTADASYFPVAWTAARTVAAQPDRDFDVLILTDAAGRPPPPGCRIIEVTMPDFVAGWPCPPHASAIAYARLAAAELWLTGYDRAVYIDSDTSIHGALAPLFSLDLGGAMLAMVEDCGHYLRDAAGRQGWDACRRAMGMDPAAVYFNSGMMVMDLARLRDARFWPRAQALLATHGDRLVFMDQDVINILAAGQIAELSPRWNFQTHYFGLGLEAEIPPVIRHYLDVLKPWRDPEWQSLHGLEAPRHFARLFRHSPWSAYMPRGLFARFRPPWQHRAALRQAEAGRHLNAENVVCQLAKYQAPALRNSIRASLRASLSAGRFLDSLSI